MALKDFDYKQFFIEKGEKVGLGVAVGLLALFLVVAAMDSLSAGSPAEKAKTLKDATQRVQTGLANNTPTEADKPSAEASNRTFAFEYNPLEEDPYLLAGSLFHPESGTDPNRARPTIFNIQEARVAIDRVQVRSYIFNTAGDRTMVYYLKGAAADKSSYNDLMGGLGSGGDSGYGSDVLGGGMEDPTGGEGLGGSPGSMLGMPGGFGSSGGEKTKEYEPVPIDITKLRSQPNIKLAEQVRPLRMAIIGASFPYKQQLDEFRDKLRLGSYGEVLAERSVETGPGGRPLPNFRFLGVEVERQILAPDGKVLRDWSTLDLRNTYRPFVFLTGKRFEPTDPKYAAVTFPGLVMPLLLRFQHDQKAKEGDAKDRYPQVADKLALLQKALEALKGTKPAEIPRPDARFSTDNFDPFNPNPSPPTTGGGYPGTGSGGYPGAGPGVSGSLGGMPGGGPMAGSGENGYMGGPLGGGYPGGSSPMPGGFQGSGTGSSGFPGRPTTALATTVPEHCLVRLVDLTVQPGLNYKYRVRVRMANPNYGRKDVMSPTYSQDKELLSGEWFTIDQLVQVPPELEYYTVDQHFLDESRTRLAPLRNNQTVLQMHRWLDTVKKSNEAQPLLVGEWVVAERVPVFRGEYVGRDVRLKFPVWRSTRDDFVIEGEVEKRRGRRNPPEGIPVDFGVRRMDGLETILVDFEEGQASVDYEGEKVRESSADEVLLMGPDGILRTRNSVADAKDEQRLERLKYFRDRLKNVEEKKKPATGGAPGAPGAGSDSGAGPGIFDCGS